MKTNRSIPSATVVPVLIYPDVRAAVAWLEEAFGFVERVRIGEDHRAQLAFGDGAVIVADVRGDRRPPAKARRRTPCCVRVEDANAHCERARSRGARILMEPTDFEYGERQYAAEDLAGHRWTFAETLDDVAPEDWGGILVTPLAVHQASGEEETSQYAGSSRGEGAFAIAANGAGSPVHRSNDAAPWARRTSRPSTTVSQPARRARRRAPSPSRRRGRRDRRPASRGTAARAPRPSPACS